MSVSIHPSVSLGYSVPTSRGFRKYNDVKSKEQLLMGTLKLDDQPKPTEVKYSNTPISREFYNSSDKTDPLSDLIKASRHVISQYVAHLPYDVSDTKQTNTFMQTQPNPTESDTTSVFRKRVRSSSFDESEYNDSVLDLYSTPIPNKTIYFASNLGSSKPLSSKTSCIFQNTPTKLKKKPSEKLLRGEMAVHEFQDSECKSSELKTMASTPMKETPAAELQSTPVTEDEDPLACHADKILRMAVDSTLLGSSYNGSLSLNYSCNDSLNGIISHKKNTPVDIFDDNDPEKSLLELRKQKWNMLSKDKAVKVEINAEDLNSVLNGL